MTQNLVRHLLSHRDLRDVSAVLLFGGPCVLVGGHRLEVPEGSKRLLVFITLSDGVVDRRHAAASLWPDANDERAAGNLRSALWRLRPGTLVDVREVADWADRLAAGSAVSADLGAVTWSTAALDLLPGWYD